MSVPSMPIELPQAQRRYSQAESAGVVVSDGYYTMVNYGRACCPHMYRNVSDEEYATRVPPEPLVEP